MKRILSAVLTVAMLLSLAAITAIPVFAEDEGDWIVYASSGEHRDDFNPVEQDYACVPGYSYVAGKGLVVTPAGWSDCNPKFGIQTKEKIDIRNGVYMVVRIDEFSYDASDKWFSFSISDKQYISVGSQDIAKDGERIIGMVRPNNQGKVSSVAWYYSNFKGASSTNMTFTQDSMYAEDGDVLLVFCVSYDKSTGYKVTLNGAEMPKVAAEWMLEHFADGDAYVGLNVMNNKKGGTAACTLCEFGENEFNSYVPYGTDEANAVTYPHTNAEIAEPDTVPEGQPAVFLNGSREHSDSKTTTKNSGPYSLTEENYIHYLSPKSKVELLMSVKKEVSYDIYDFPYILVMVRNFCTCGES